MRQGHRLLFVLNAIAWRIVIAISIIVLMIGFVVLCLEWPPSEIRAAASLNYSTIDYAKVTCVTKARDAAAAKALPHVVRPGMARSSAERNQADLRVLSAKLSSSGDIRDAVALYNARKSTRR